MQPQSVAISQCGTFALVGSAGGSIDLFNMQSGLHRQRFPAHLSRSLSKHPNIDRGSVATPLVNGGRHTKSVTGLMVDALNQTVISCGLDGKVKVRFSIDPLIIAEANQFSLLCM